MAILFFQIKIKRLWCISKTVNCRFHCMPFLCCRHYRTDSSVPDQIELGKASRLPGPSHAQWTTSSLKLGQVPETWASDISWMSPFNFLFVFLGLRNVEVLVFLARSHLKDSFCVCMNGHSGRSTVSSSRQWELWANCVPLINWLEGGNFTQGKLGFISYS